jgi:nitrate/nitrite transporter NarK
LGSRRRRRLGIRQQEHRPPQSDLVGGGRAHRLLHLVHLVGDGAVHAVYGFTAGDKFLLGATATLVGACLRIPYTLATATFGGRNASSMTNINAFYPQRLKGWALGVNAGGGNIGVPMVQLVGLLVIATAGNRQPYWVCAVYLGPRRR